MRAMLLTGYGGVDKLQYRVDYPVPKPGVGEVLVKVAACGVNNTDVWTREGAYGAEEQSAWQGIAFQFPRIQGADIVGEIVALGYGVDASRMGDRVMVNPTLYDESGYAGLGGNAVTSLFNASYIGSERDGGFAEYACVPQQNAHTVDSALGDAELATFMTSYMTALHMLNRADLKAGETVLITGASGGVGSALVQLARVRGARVVAVIGRGKEQYLTALGVDDFVYRDDTDLSNSLKKFMAAGAISVVADIVGGAQVPQLLEGLCMGGRYVTAGAIAGPMVTLDWRKVYLKHFTLLGSTMGTQEESKQIVSLVESGQLKPLLSATYTLKNLVQAQQDFKHKAHFGKLAIVP